MVLKFISRLLALPGPAPRVSVLFFVTSFFLSSVFAETLAKAEIERSPITPSPAGTIAYEPPFERYLSPAAPLQDITRGGTDAMEVALTFDGGGEANDAGTILRILEERDVKATMFLTGEFIMKNPGLVKRMALEGHEAGNHTMTHPHLTDFSNSLKHTTAIDKDVLLKELRGTRRLYSAVTGFEMAPLWRAPFGEINTELLSWGYEEGFMHTGWTRGRGESLDTLDWVSDRASALYRSPEEIKKRVLDFGKGSHGLSGGIILMHLGTDRDTERAAEALGELIDELKGRGYRLVKVSELLKDNQAYRALNGADGKRLAGLE